MLEQLPHIAVAAVLCLLIFVSLDIVWKLPKAGGVSGADAVGKELHKSGGNLNGGYMIGNIISSPDASSGLLFAACGYYIYGVIGAAVAAVLVFIGARICADKGYAGVSGVVVGTIAIYLCTTYLGFAPEVFIAGIILAILVVEGLSLTFSSRVLGKLWGKRT